MIRMRKVASIFGRLVNIWKSKNISLAVKIRLYETCHLNPAVRCRIMATICHTNEKIRSKQLTISSKGD